MEQNVPQPFSKYKKPVELDPAYAVPEIETSTYNPGGDPTKSGGNTAEPNKWRDSGILSTLNEGVLNYTKKPAKALAPVTRPPIIEPASPLGLVPFDSGVKEPAFDSGVTPPSEDMTPTWRPGMGQEQRVPGDLPPPSTSDFIQTEYSSSGMDTDSMQRISNAQDAHNSTIELVSSLEGAIGVDRSLALNDAVNGFIERTGDNHNAYMDGYEKVMNQMDSVSADMVALAEKKINPDRYLENMTGTNKALMVILAFAEGFAGKGGKDSFALNHLDSKIQQDIALQERDLAAQTKSKDGELNFLGQKLAKLGTIEAAKQSMILTSYEAAKIKIEALTQGANARIAPEKAQEIIAGIEVKQAETMAQSLQGSFKNVGLMTSEQIVEDPLRNVAWDRSVNLPDGTVGVMNSVNEATMFNQLSGSAASFNELAEEAKKLRIELTSSAASMMNPTMVSAKKQNLMNITNGLRVALGNINDVTPSKEGIKMLKDLIGDQTGLSFAISDVENAQKSINSKVQNMWKTSGIGVVGKQEDVREYRMMDKQQLTKNGI